MKVGRPALARLARHWPLLPALAVALVLRLVDLFPGFYHGDEAEYVIVARALAHDPGDLAYPPVEGFAPVPFVSQPPLLLYLFAASIRLLGVEHGPVLVSVALGTATVAVTYLLGLRLRDRWLGAIAALVLAVLPYHVGVSRAAQLDAGLAFFAALAALAFLRWLDVPSWPRAFAVGLAVAAACLSKLPGVLVAAPMLLVLAAQLVRARREARKNVPGARERLRELGGSAGIAALPVLLAASLYVAFLWSLGATRDLIVKLGWQAERVAGHLNTQATDRPWHWYFTVKEVGLLGQLGTVVAVLAIIGAILVARAIAKEPTWRAQRMFLLLWPAAVLGFFMSSGRKEWFDLMPAMPAVALLAAWPLQPMARGLSSFIADGRPWRPGVAVAWLAAFVVLAAASPVHATWTERIQRQGRFGDGVPEAARWIGDNDPGAGQVGTTLARFTLYLENGGDTLHYYVNHTYVEERIASGDVRYVVIDTDLNLTFEQQWLYGLVADHGGKLAFQQPTPGGDPVRVYRLH